MDSEKFITVRRRAMISFEDEGDPRILYEAMLKNIQRIKDDMNKFNDDAEEKEE